MLTTLVALFSMSANLTYVVIVLFVILVASAASLRQTSRNLVRSTLDGAGVVIGGLSVATCNVCLS